MGEETYLGTRLSNQVGRNKEVVLAVASCHLVIVQNGEAAHAGKDEVLQELGARRTFLWGRWVGGWVDEGGGGWVGGSSPNTYPR